MTLRALSLSFLLLLSFSFHTQAEDINRSTEYPSPMGIYKKVGVSNSLTVGVQSTATSLTTVTGNVNLTGGNIALDESLAVGGNTLRVYPLCTNPPECTQGTHFTGINVSGRNADAELEVNGDVIAHRFRASRGINDTDQLLYLGVSSDGQRSEMGAKHGLGWNATIYNQFTRSEVMASVARFHSDPYIILNGGGGLDYSNGNVGIGVTNPVTKLQVGEAGLGLTAIAHSWDTLTSSRQFKADIQPLNASNYKIMLQKLAALNVVRFHYKHYKPGQRLRIGVLTEEAPHEILTDDKKTQSTVDTIGFLLAVTKELKSENDALEKEVARLEREIK